MINVPFVISDATSLTETGYVGDEIDKIARTSSGRSTTRDISGDGLMPEFI